MEKSRAELLRRRNRRIYGWSFATAVVLHVLVLVYGPWFRSEPLARSGIELVEGGTPNASGVPLDLFFGPPAIVVDADSLHREPPSRFLRVKRLVAPPLGCERGDWSAVETAVGEVRLAVNETGRIDEVDLTQSTGHRCWDLVVQRVAGDLRYHWIPSDRFPAPVELYQPIRATRSER